MPTIIITIASASTSTRRRSDVETSQFMIFPSSYGSPEARASDPCPVERRSGRLDDSNRLSSLRKGGSLQGRMFAEACDSEPSRVPPFQGRTGLARYSPPTYLE